MLRLSHRRCSAGKSYNADARKTGFSFPTPSRRSRKREVIAVGLGARRERQAHAARAGDNIASRGARSLDLETRGYRWRSLQQSVKYTLVGLAAFQRWPCTSRVSKRRARL